MTTTMTGRCLTTHEAIKEVLTADDIAALLEDAAPWHDRRPLLSWVDEPPQSCQSYCHHRSHTLATLAPHLLKLAKVIDRRPLDRGPSLHPVPIRHGRFPVKPAVIRHLL